MTMKYYIVKRVEDGFYLRAPSGWRQDHWTSDITKAKLYRVMPSSYILGWPYNRDTNTRQKPDNPKLIAVEVELTMKIVAEHV